MITPIDKDCNHKWMVITSVQAVEWHTFFAYRGEKVDELPISEMRTTHKLICGFCHEIKDVK